MANLTTRILIEIRDEARKTNERLGRLERRQVETEVRLATELASVVGAVHEVRDAITTSNRISERVEDHERRLATLEQASPR